MLHNVLPVIALSVLVVSCAVSNPVPWKPPASDEAAYYTDFEQDPFEEGWEWGKATWEKKAGKPGTAKWVERAGGGKCLEVHDGMWRSPNIQVQPLAFYRVRIVSKTAGAGYWGLLSYDKTDTEIPASPYSKIPASKKWVKNDAVVLVPEDAVCSRVLIWPREKPIRADNIVVDRVTRDEALKIADKIYSEVPEVEAEYAESTQAGLQHVRETLEQGGNLRVLLLGDSVTNDMGNSNFQLLLEREYPDARVTLLNKVGSGASADRFLKGGKIGKMLQKHDPDLVMFGGISNGKKDIPDIRKLANRVKEHDDADFLAFTGTMLMPRYWKNFDRGQSHRQPYREALKKAGRKSGFAVCDLGGAWEAYATGCDRPIAYFRRDGHHANERGKQVYGHLMAEYFLSAM